MESLGSMDFHSNTDSNCYTYTFSSSSIYSEKNRLRIIICKKQKWVRRIAEKTPLVKQENIDGGLITVIVEGDVGAVQAAVDAGKEAVKWVGVLVGAYVIPRPDQWVHDMIMRQRQNLFLKKTGKRIT
jgi:hypothetical protein